MRLQLQIDNVDHSAILSSISINKELGSRTSTATFSLAVTDLDPTAGAIYGTDDYGTGLLAYTDLPQIHSKILFKNHVTGSVLFRGFATIISKRQENATFQIWDVTASGFDTILDGVILNKSYTSKTDYEIIADAFSTTGISPVSITVSPDYVQAILPAFDYQAKDITLRSLLEDLSAMSGAEWRITTDRQLEYLPAGSQHAPFGFSNDPDLVSFFPWRIEHNEFSGTAFANRVKVLGGVLDPVTGRSLSGVANDLVSQAALALRNTTTDAKMPSIISVIVVNRDLTTQVQVDAAAQAELEARKILHKLSWEYDDLEGIEVGMMVPIQSPPAQINSEYEVQSIQMVQMSPTWTKFIVEGGLFKGDLGSRLGSGNSSSSVSGGNASPQATFIFGVSNNGGAANLVLGGITNLAIAKQAGTLAAWDAATQFPPTGADAIFDILKVTDSDPSGTSIFGASPKPTIPAGSTDLQTGSTFDGTVPVAVGDRFLGVVTQVGSTTKGKSVSINLYWA